MAGGHILRLSARCALPHTESNIADRELQPEKPCPERPAAIHLEAHAPERECNPYRRTRSTRLPPTPTAAICLCRGVAHAGLRTSASDIAKRSVFTTKQTLTTSPAGAGRATSP